MERINATLTHIRFQNRETGFLIGIFLQGRQEFAALGSMVGPEVGMDYTLSGEWVENEKFGRQYKFVNYEVVAPKSTDGIYRYLVKVARWVGPKVGQALIDHYKEETLNIIRTDPERVARQIRGITPARAAEMQAKIIENQAIEATLVELENLIGGQGLKQSLPTELLAKYGSNAVAELRLNPYMLTEFKQIGFLQADKVALTKFEIKPQSVRRQQAAALHIIEQICFQEGSVWVEEHRLIAEVTGLISCDPAPGLVKLAGARRIVINEGFVALKYLADNEEYVAKKFIKMLA